MVLGAGACFCSSCQLGFLVSLYPLPRICPNGSCRQLFFIPYSFFVFYCWRRGCSGINFAAMQQRVPDPRPVSFPTEKLYIVLKMLKILKLLPAGQGPQTLAYPRGVDVPRWLFQGPVGAWATLHWNGLSSLSHHEPYIKLLEPKGHKLNQKVKQARDVKQNSHHWRT